jgi:hypothetical protein
MNEETALVANDEMEELQRQLAQGSNERVDTFASMPTLSVSNQSQDPAPGAEPGVEPGQIISSIRTENGYENEPFQNPFKGIILRQRMFLRTKFEAQKNGAPKLITDEFDSYSDSEIITVKKQSPIDGKWVEDFVGNYKQVVAKYSDSNQFGKVNKYLDLQYNLYVCVSLAEKKIVRIQVKGKSRAGLFDFMKKFTRKAGDFMSSTFVTFSTEKHLNDFNGNPLKFPVWSFSYTKNEPLDLPSLKAAIALQNELNDAIAAREAAFGKKEYAEVTDASHAELPQGSPAEDIPTINLDDERDVEEIQIKDVPFK